MNKIQKIKQHVIDNKAIYITGGVCLVVGVVGGVVLTHKVEVKQVVDSWKIQYKSPTTNHVTQEVTVIVPPRGHRGNIVIDELTGRKWGSQNEAAKELGVSPTTVARHLKGALPDAGGHKLVSLGENLGEKVTVSAA